VTNDGCQTWVAAERYCEIQLRDLPTGHIDLPQKIAPNVFLLISGS
jgi:hypothetical protein